MPLAKSHGFVRTLVVVVLVLALLASCGRRGSSKIAGPPANQGVPSEAVTEAVHAIDFAHFVLLNVTYGWDPDGVLDRSWHYDAPRSTWTRLDSSYSSVFVGSGTGGPSYEIRNESVVAFELRLLQGSIPVQNLADADSAWLDIRTRLRRYSLDHHVLPESYDVTVTHGLGFPIVSGDAGDFATSGRVYGWAAKSWNGVPQLWNYDGTVESNLTYAALADRCPSERMATSFAVTRDGREVDRYSGAVTADEGVEIMTGSIHSERGSGAIVINRSRGCPALSSSRP